MALDMDGKECSKLRVATPRDYEGTVRAIVGLVEAMVGGGGAGFIRGMTS